MEGRIAREGKEWWSSTLSRRKRGRGEKGGKGGRRGGRRDNASKDSSPCVGPSFSVCPLSCSHSRQLFFPACPFWLCMCQYVKVCVYAVRRWVCISNSWSRIQSVSFCPVSCHVYISSQSTLFPWRSFLNVLFLCPLEYLTPRGKKSDHALRCLLTWW